jgi:opacity protein-like surface antigen
MKRIITITLLSFLTIFSAAAQEDESSMKGKYLLGTYTNIVSVGWADIALAPTVGYFLTDDIAVILRLNYQSQNDNGDPSTFDGEYIDNDLSLSTNVRYYLNDELFLTAGFGIVNGSTVNNYNDGSAITDEIRENGFGFNAGAGLSLMWGERVAIEPEFVISSSSSSIEQKSGNTTTISDGPTQFGAGFRIGLSLRL